MMVIREPFEKAFTTERNACGAERSGLCTFTECLLHHEEVLPTRPDESSPAPAAPAALATPAEAPAPMTPTAEDITRDVVEGLKGMLFDDTGEKTAELKKIEATAARAAKRGGAITTRKYCFKQALTGEDTIEELETFAAAADKKMDAEDKTAKDNAKIAASATTYEEKAMAQLGYNTAERKPAGWRTILSQQVELFKARDEIAKARAELSAARAAAHPKSDDDGTYDDSDNDNDDDDDVVCEDDGASAQTYIECAN